MNKKILANNEQIRTIFRDFLDFWGPVLFTIFLYVGIRNYIAEARYIPSGSMLPGLQIKDRLLIEKITYRSRSPKRGEIVVFNSPFAFNSALGSNETRPWIKCSLLNFPLFSLISGISDPVCDAYIKRVVAVAGDQINVNSMGQVRINNILSDEPYVTHYCDDRGSLRNQCLSIEHVVPKGNVLVLGDNRSNSWDGRFWPGSPFLPEDEIIGRALWRFWPISRLKIFRY